MNSYVLYDVALRLSPEMMGAFDWADIWERPIENGAAYEWTMIAALIHEAKENGYAYDFPILKDSSLDLKKLFSLRNEVPFQHSAQAGHSLDESNFSLANLFKAALIPKVHFYTATRSISLFTEGYPYHKLMTRKQYTERPDIVIVEGNLTKEMPNLTNEDSLINFGYDPILLPPVSGQLRTIRNSVIPMTKREPISGCELPVLAIIETSVNKSYKKALEQITRYKEVFSIEEIKPHLFLVSGNKVEGPELEKYFTDLNGSDIFNDFCFAAGDILRKSGLI